MNFRLFPALFLLLTLPAQGADTAAPAPEVPANLEADEAPPVLRLPAERAETHRAKVLVEQLTRLERADEVNWLGDGDERFLTLYRADSSGQPFANLLLLHDSLQHPDWPGVVRGLREEMSRHGWHTLSIAVPDYRPLPDLPPLPVPEPPPEAEPEDDANTAAAEAPVNTKAPAKPAEPAEQSPPAEEGTPEDAAAEVIPEKPVEYSPEQVPEVLEARIRAALAFLKQKDPAPVVVVTIGLAAGLSAVSGALQTQDVAGLVLIDPAPAKGDSVERDLNALILPIPVLDISPQFAPHSARESRSAHARREGREQYEQRVINGAQRGFAGYESQVVRLVRGWGNRLFKSAE